MDAQSLQFVCSVIYDLLNDAVQCLRNIIVLKDSTSALFVAHLPNLL